MTTENRRDAALSLWWASKPALGTPVETYLNSRGITLPVPPTLKWNAATYYAQSSVHLGAMVAAVQAPDRRITAVHRTYLTNDGRDKASVVVPKKALGPIGNGAVRLGHVSAVIGIAEGIETALSAMQAFEIPCWAALGGRFDRITIPAKVIEVQIFADNGEAGHIAAEKAADALTSAGKRVALRYPPEGIGDWNDALLARASA